MLSRTKIIATLGPSSQSESILVWLAAAGVNVIRFNFSHANHAGARQAMDLIRRLNSEGKTNFSTLLDTKGPELRTGNTPEMFHVRKDDRFIISATPDYIHPEYSCLSCDYPYISEDLSVGDVIKIDSGLLDVVVESVLPDALIVRAENDLCITPRRHVNLPGVKIRLPGVTEKDREDILFWIQEWFDFIAMSFVRSAENVEELQNLLREKGAEHMKIIAKIENEEGIENIDEILAVSDGVMVARGDLGIEVPIAMLPLYQNMIIDKAQELGKFTIVATHILESMIQNPFPTRAEVSDIFHSVEQQTDAIMLSGETANGKYPIESARTMRTVADEAEKHVVPTQLDFSNEGLSERDVEKKYLLWWALDVSEMVSADAVLVFTKSGLLAKLISAFRPNIPVFAFTPKATSVRFMNILFGITPFLLSDWSEHEQNLENAIRLLETRGLVNKETKIVAVTDIVRNGNEIPALEIIRVRDYLGA